jgi:hypothetical protein
MNLYVSLFDGIWRVFLNDLRQTFDPVFAFSVSSSLPLRQNVPHLSLLSRFPKNAKKIVGQQQAARRLHLSLPQPCLLALLRLLPAGLYSLHSPAILAPGLETTKTWCSTFRLEEP